MRNPSPPSGHTRLRQRALTDTRGLTSPGAAPFQSALTSVTRQQLRGPGFLSLLRGVRMRAPTGPVRFEDRCRAALLALPDACLDRLAAAVLWRLPVDPPDRISLTRAADAGASERPELLVRRADLHADDRDVCRGLPVTALARTWVDLGAVLDVVELVCVGDVVLRRLSAPAETAGADRCGDGEAAARSTMSAAVGRARGRRGVATARAALPLLDARSASPGETRCRLLLHEAGFRALRHAVPIRDRAGGWIAEGDLADVTARVLVQYDGLIHLLGDPRQRAGDIARDELSRMAGWEVVVLTAHDLAHPSLAIHKVASAYERAADRRRGRAA